MNSCISKEGDCVVVPVHLEDLCQCVLDRELVVVVVNCNFSSLVRLGTCALIALALLGLCWETLLWLSLLLLPELLASALMSGLLLGSGVLRHLDEMVEVWHVLHELLHVAYSAQCVGNYCIQINIRLLLPLTLVP